MDKQQISPSSPALIRWSTEDVEPNRRLDFWADAICEVYLRAKCTPMSYAPFQGVIESISRAGLTLTRMHTTSLAMRTLASDPASIKEVVYAVTHSHANWAFKQQNHFYQLRQGDVAMIDAREPYEVLFHEGASLCVVQLPVSWLREHLRCFDSFGSQIVSRDEGWGRMLSTFCLELSRDLVMTTQVPEVVLADQLGGLLAAAIEPSAGDRTGSKAQTLRAQAEKLFLQRLGEPALAAAEVARLLGVSVRTIHRAFEDAGTTFSATMRRRRMEHALALLKRPNLADLSVAQIGESCGFQDASHFSREFRRAWGTSPGKWRQLNST